MEISNDGQSAVSVTVKDGIAAKVELYVNDRGEIECRTAIVFVDEINQRMSPERASVESST
jgi:hypothetical protein